MTATTLRRVAGLLEDRLAALEERLHQGDEASWGEFLTVVNTYTTVIAQLVPERHGGFLTTQEMADRLGIAPKTLLKHKAAGSVKPVLQRGKLIRWKGDEGTR